MPISIVLLTISLILNLVSLSLPWVANTRILLPINDAFLYSSVITSIFLTSMIVYSIFRYNHIDVKPLIILSSSVDFLNLIYSHPITAPITVGNLKEGYLVTACSLIMKILSLILSVMKIGYIEIEIIE